MAVLQDGYPLKSKELTRELEKRSQRSGAAKKYATIVAKFRGKRKIASSPSPKKATERR
jgi:hypothetical protein